MYYFEVVWAYNNGNNHSLYIYGSVLTDRSAICIFMGVYQQKEAQFVRTGMRM